MRSWIVTAAPATAKDVDFFRTIRPSEGDIVVCADGGFDNAVHFGLVPDAVVGDMDSVRSSLPNTIEIKRFPAEKDKTDTHLAVDYSLERGASEIVILGTLSGRLDHTLAIIMLLRYVNSRGAEGLVLSPRSRLCLLSSGQTTIARADSKFLSIIPLSDCKGVTIRQAKFETQNVTMKCGETLGISNEFGPLNVKISIREGTALIVTEKNT